MFSPDKLTGLSNTSTSRPFGIVLHGDVDLGLANLNLIHAKLRLVVTLSGD